MACRVNYSANPEIARLQRKADQQDELGCLASLDNDKKAVAQHFAEAKELRALARELSQS